MGRLTDAATIQTLLAQGKGAVIPFVTVGTSITAIGAAGGYLNPNMSFNNIGTVVGSTYNGILLPPGTNPLRLIYLDMWSPQGGWLQNAYHLGTLDLTATGDKLTRDSWTAPLQRTIMGQANQPLTLVPVIVLRTATATTPPVIRLRTAAGGAGYVNQDGVSVVGAKTVTFPSAATTAGATFVMRLEDGDSGVQDISAIEVVTAASAGLADVYLVELLAVHGGELSAGGSIHDKLFGGLELPDLRPAVPASGSVNCLLNTCNFSNGANTNYGTIVAVEDIP